MTTTSALVDATRTEDVLTDNGAVTNSTSLNSAVDLFFLAGACRNVDDATIHAKLEKSWQEDSEITLRMIFWAGDVRGGAGERRFLRTALSWLEANYPETLEKNLAMVPFYSRWDSLFHLNSPGVIPLLHEGLENGDGLLAKWMPRKKQHGNLANKYRKAYGLSPKRYRKRLVDLSTTVETLMCRKDWDEIEYSHVPSVAMSRYNKAFRRNDETRFGAYLKSVEKGETKINAGAIFPYDIYNSYKRGGDEEAINAQWDALPDYITGAEAFLPVCDVSGSMSMGPAGDLPMAISVSLGIYLSERNKSIFKDAFITFSSKPEMQFLRGTLTSRMRQLERADWDMSTDLDAVFRLILSRAKKANLANADMPTTLLILSDMQFDRCANMTAYQSMTEQYEDAGYVIPTVAFWNVEGRAGNVPVQCDTEGVALISGASPAIFKGLLGGDYTPVKVMMTTLADQRYAALEV